MTEGLQARQGVSVGGGDSVQVAVVATRAPIPILFPDEMERRCHLAARRVCHAEQDHVVELCSGDAVAVGRMIVIDRLDHC